jgi:hypothetical protein
MIAESLLCIIFHFILLLVLTLFLSIKSLSIWEKPILEWVHFSLKSLGIFWMIYYFFPAHRRFTGTNL